MTHSLYGSTVLGTCAYGSSAPRAADGNDSVSQSARLGGTMEKALPAGSPNSPVCQERSVTILPGGITVGVRHNETIVDALRRQGLRTRYKCRRGGCGSCRAILVAGQVGYQTAVSPAVIEGSQRHDGNQYCLPCRATPHTDLVIALGPRDRVVDVLSGLAQSRTSLTAGKPTTELAT
jgi:ferredoxin